MALLLSSPAVAGDRLALADGTGIYLTNTDVATDYQVSAASVFAGAVIDMITRNANTESDVNISLGLTADRRDFLGADTNILVASFVWGTMPVG